MKKLQYTMLWKLALITLTVSMLASCTTFKRDEPSRVGMWYPNSPIKVELTKDNFFKSDEVLNLNGEPLIIKAVGKMTWNSLIGNYTETALLEIHFSNNSVGDYFATTSFLQKYGRIEYTGNKTSEDYFWESGWGYLIKFLAFIAFLYLCFALIKNHIKPKMEIK